MRKCILTMTLGILMTAMAWAQGEEPQGTTIRLHELMRAALQKNLSYQRARLQPDAAEARYLMESAPFNPQFLTSFNASKETQPAASDLAGAPTLEQKRNLLDLSLSQRLSWGTEIRASLSQTRFETNSIFYTLNPQHIASFTLEVTQPLLRGFGPWNAQAGLRAARKRMDGAQAQVQEAAQDLLAQVAKAYWDLAFAHKNLEVQKNALQLAEQLLHDIEVQIRLGVKAPIERTSAQAEVALRRQNVVQATNAVQAATDRLKALVETTQALMQRPREIWTPIDEPPEEIPLPDQDTLIRMALEQRPILQAVRDEVEAAQTEYRAAQNQRLPQLNLTGRYSLYGLGGDRQIFSGFFFDRKLIDVIPGRFTDALNQVLRGEFPTWSIGMQLVWPLKDTAAQSRLLQAEVQLQQAKIDLEAQRQNVVLQVRNAYRNLLAAHESYQAARASVQWQRQNLKAERRKLDLGLSTNFVVLQYQNNLARAESQLMQARTAYAKAWVDLLRAIGRLGPDTVTEYRLFTRGTSSSDNGPDTATPARDAANR